MDNIIVLDRYVNFTKKFYIIAGFNEI